VGCQDALLPGVSLAAAEWAGCEAMSLELSGDSREFGLSPLETSVLTTDSKACLVSISIKSGDAWREL